MGRRGIILLIIILIAMFSFGGISIEMLAYSLPAVLIAMAFHEFAHAFVADRLGDPTPRNQGRLTLDIRKHIDPFGLLMLLFVGFGWGKPVETDPRNLKNPKRDMAFIAVAGPIMNILIAIITVIIMVKTGLFVIEGNSIMPSSNKMSYLTFRIFFLNAVFAVFNLIPIPGFDGSRIIGAFMSDKTYRRFVEFEYRHQFEILIILIIVLSVDTLSMKLFGPIISFAGVLLNFSIMLSNLLPF